MTQEQIIEGNRLIAEFMKFSVTEHNGQLMWFDHIGARDVLYHKSWDWLMPVVEKIPTLNEANGKQWFEWGVSRCYCHIWSNDSQVNIKENGGSALEATYSAVIQFITWLNDKQ